MEKGIEIVQKKNSCNILTYLKLHAMGLTVADGFASDERVVIHGLGLVGRLIYNDIKDKVQVLCFVDRVEDRHAYDMVPVFTLDNKGLKKILERDKITVIVTPIYDAEAILESYKVRGYEVCGKTLTQIMLPIMLNKIGKNRANVPHEFIKNVLENRTSEINGINILGNQYGLLLCLLYQEDFKNKLYIVMGNPFDSSFDEIANKDNLTILHMYRHDLLDESDFVEAFLDVLASYSKEMHLKTICHFFCREGSYFLDDNFVLLEEGIGSYLEKQEYESIVESDMSFNAYLDEIKHVLMTGLKPVPKDIAHKVELISLTELWEKKTDPEKQYINQLLNYPYEEIDNCIREKRNIMILTSPYADINIVSVKRQIEIITDIIKKYDYERLIIKPHPRDTIQYEKSFKGIKCIRGNFPIELIKLNGIRLEKVIGFGTSAIETLRDVYKVENYDRSIFIDEG